MLARHEPLWRYLIEINGKEPLSAMMQDLEEMAKENAISSKIDGSVALHETDTVKAEIDRLTRASMPPQPNLHHMMFQSIQDKLFITMSNISDTYSKTAMALCINEDDTVVVDYLEPSVLMEYSLHNRPLWNSISTVVAMPDGTLKRGFVRVETTILQADGRNSIVLKCDFKLSRSSPLYVYIEDVISDKPRAITGAKAKVKCLAMEAAWTASSTC